MRSADDYQKQFISISATSFIQSRGRSGRVLSSTKLFVTTNQRTLVTNDTYAFATSAWRGVYFDKQSNKP